MGFDIDMTVAKSRKCLSKPVYGMQFKFKTHNSITVTCYAEGR